MGYIYSWLNNFDGVAKVYEGIEPLRGQRKAQDIRPLRKRKKWWERIIKVDDNTYVLSDGYYAYSYGAATDPEKHADDRVTLLETAPIIWSRRPDGDYIQIRSNPNSSGSWSRYKFIDEFLPQGLVHHFNSTGRHYIRHDGHDSLLPKFIRKYEYDTATKDHKITIKEDKYVEYRHEGGNKFTRTSTPHKLKVPIINRSLTKKYNPMIRDLWKWGLAVLPVFGDTLMEQRKEYADRFYGGSTWYWSHRIDPEMLLDWLAEPEKYYEERLAFLVMAVFKIDAITEETRRHIGVGKGVSHTVRFNPEATRAYERFRHLVITVGGMQTTKEVETN